MRLGRTGLLGALAATTVLSGVSDVNAVPTAVSADIVTLLLVVGTSPARVSVPSGEMARIGIRNEQTLGLIPSVGGINIDSEDGSCCCHHGEGTHRALKACRL
jgi:hypothetical protein